MGAEDGSKARPAAGPGLAVEQAVLSYLAHHGYGRTAAALLAQWPTARPDGPAPAALAGLESRRHAARLVSCGQPLSALEHADTAFPGVLDGPLGRWLRFQLQTAAFVEFVRAGDSASALSYVESTLAPQAAGPEADPRMLAHLHDAAVLLAYADPLASPAAHLLSQETRDALAERLNAAILGRPQSVLETLVQQAAECASELSRVGGSVPEDVALHLRELVPN